MSKLDRDPIEEAKIERREFVNEMSAVLRDKTASELFTTYSKAPVSKKPLIIDAAIQNLIEFDKVNAKESVESQTSAHIGLLTFEALRIDKKIDRVLVDRITEHFISHLPQTLAHVSSGEFSNIIFNSSPECQGRAIERLEEQDYNETIQKTIKNYKGIKLNSEALKLSRAAHSTGEIPSSPTEMKVKSMAENLKTKSYEELNKFYDEASKGDKKLIIDATIRNLKEFEKLDLPSVKLAVSANSSFLADIVYGNNPPIEVRTIDAITDHFMSNPSRTLREVGGFSFSNVINSSSDDAKDHAIDQLIHRNDKISQEILGNLREDNPEFEKRMIRVIASSVHTSKSQIAANSTEGLKEERRPPLHPKTPSAIRTQ